MFIIKQNLPKLVLPKVPIKGVSPQLGCHLVFAPLGSLTSNFNCLNIYQQLI